MKYRILFILFLFTAFNAGAQFVTVQGTVQDTAEQKPLRYAVVMMIRINDSLLTGFSRTNAEGFFKIDSVPADTYKVVISHPRFGDQEMILLANKDNPLYDFKKLILPPKSVTLNEVTVFGFANPVYFKGDTLVYTADSFKVKKNAVVEDLLKKLPGIKVEADGKIYAQGKQVDQVLVDGDEFFGPDATIATKNLAASSVESVQVYDKKNENTSESDEKETLKIMDLKLKEDAKKGYFGKISGAGDFNKFYEGSLLANKFSGKQKLSVFALGSNTPRSQFDWGDMYKYGIDDNENRFTDDDGSYYWTWNDNRAQGIPKTFKSGFYYTDQLSKKTKLSLNYTYADANLDASSSTAYQYFFSDTSYKSDKYQRSQKDNKNHSPNLTIKHDLDSLTTIVLESKLKYSTGSQSNYENHIFRTLSDSATRITNSSSSYSLTNYTWNNTVNITRNFKKRDRKLVANYGLKLSNSDTDGFLHSNDTSEPDSSIEQKKETASDQQTHNGSLTYTEPVGKKVKLEFNYDFSLNEGKQEKKTLDYMNGSYNKENPALTNSFETKRSINRAGGSFIYEVKKYR